MQTVFLVEEEWNLSLVKRVHNEYRKSGRRDQRVDYAGLHWRIISHREVQADIIGVRLKTIPRVLRYANYEISFYDFIINANFATGFYKDGKTEAIVVTQPDKVTRLEIIGDSLKGVNNLYTQITWGLIDPIIPR